MNEDEVPNGTTPTDPLKWVRELGTPSARVGSSSSPSAEAEPTIWGHIGKTLGRAATGVVQEIAEFGASAARILPGDQSGWAHNVQDYGNGLRDRTFGAKSEGGWGFAEDVAQFGISMLIPLGAVGKGVGAGLKAATAIEVAGVGARVAKGAEAIAVAASRAPTASRFVGRALTAEMTIEAKAAIGMDPVEQNLANMLTKVPWFKDSTFLHAVSSDDNDIGGRLNSYLTNVVGGAAIGTAFKGVGGLYTKFFGSRFAKQVDAATEWAIAKRGFREGKVTLDQLEAAAVKLEAHIKDAANVNSFTRENLQKGLADYRKMRDVYEVLGPASAKSPQGKIPFPKELDGLPDHAKMDLLTAKDKKDYQDTIDELGKRFLKMGDAPVQHYARSGDWASTIYREGDKAVVVVRHRKGDIPPYIDIMYTDPAHRGKRIASDLLEKARSEWRTKHGEDIAVRLDDLSPQRVEQLSKEGLDRPAFYMNDAGDIVKVIGYADTEAEAIAKTFAANDAAGLMGDMELAMLSDLRHAIGSSTSTIDADQLLEGVRFNFHYLGTNEGGRKMMRAVEEGFADAFEKHPEGWDKTIAEAARDLAGRKEGKALYDKSLTNPNERYKLLARRAMLRAQAQYASVLSEIVEHEGGAVSENVDKLGQVLEQMYENMQVVAETSSVWGQNLNSLKIDPSKVPLGGVVKDEMKQQAEMALKDGEDAVAASMPRSFLEGKTPKDILMVARTLRMTSDPGDFANILRVLGKTKGALPKEESAAWSYLQSLRYNAMLSSTKTQFINAASNALMTAWRPIELMGSGLVRLDQAALEEGRQRFLSIAASIPDAWKQAKMAWTEGKPVLDKQLREISQRDAMYLPESFLGRMSVLWNVPTKALMASDELFKNINYTVAVRAQAVREGLEQGFRGARLNDYVNDAVKASRDDNGRFLNDQAIEYARESTFTRELEQGGRMAEIAAKIEGKDGVSKTLRWFFPFVRTPANIFLAATERTPVLWAFSKRMQADLAAGGVRAAEARAKIDMGNLAFSTAAIAVASGEVTGAGPAFKDRDARDQLQSAGWKPYSIKVGDQYIPYQGIEPLSTILGTIADAWEANRALFAKGEQDEFQLSMVSGIINNLTNKSFLQGIAGLSDLFTGTPEDKARLMTNLTKQVIPGSALLNEVGYVSDPHFREAKSYAEKIRASLPFFNKGLEPQYNVFGQPMMKSPVDIGDRVLGPAGALAGSAVSPWLQHFSESRESQQLIAKIQEDIGDQVKLPKIPENWKISHTGKSLRDRVYWSNDPKNRQSPYDRMQQLIGKPDGRLYAGRNTEALPPFEDFVRLVMAEDYGALRRYVSPTKAKEMLGWNSGLREIYGDDGVSRESRVDTRKHALDRAYEVYKNAAMEQVRTEYPKLDAEISRVTEVRDEARGRAKDIRRESSRQGAVEAFLETGK